jgi:hypothetical protein
MFEKNVFISHSAKNKEIADHLCAFIARLGVKEKKIFCSSVVGQGIGNGEKLNNAIATAIRKSSLLIFLISYDFINSSYCMEELGVGWYLSQQGKATCYYLVLPDIELSDLVGFVNSKIDKFSFLDNTHSNELSALSCDLCKQLNLKMKSHTEITNAETVFLSSIKSTTEALILAHKERKQEIEKHANEIEALKQLLEQAQIKIENSEASITKLNDRSKEKDFLIELHTIEDIFADISYTSLIPKEFPSSLDKDFWFDWISRYEELLEHLQRSSSSYRVEFVISIVYLTNGSFEMAYSHLLKCVQLKGRHTSIYDFDYFAKKYPDSMQEIIELLQRFYSQEKEGSNKDYLAEAIDFLLKRETALSK